MAARWLSIVGIGEDGREGLGGAARALVDAAELVVGGPRHLALIGALKAEKMPWASPLEATVPAILARRGRPVAVLASGDPFWFGAGVTLARHVPAEEMIVAPAPSAFSLAVARLGWTLQDTVTLGLNSGLFERIVPHLHHGARILALSLNASTPSAVAKVLHGHGFGPSQITVLEALGGPREKIRAGPAEAFDLDGVDPLNIIAIDVAAGPDARPIARAGGLPDTFFENDGQLTKREIRAVTISSLAPSPGQRLWDAGLGSGSVAIEWLLSHPRNTAIGFERDSARAARAARNALSLGTPHLVIVQGAAPEAFKGAAAPDAIFIGGGAADDGVFEACWAALKSGGRMVVNAVTLETEARLLAAHAALEGRLTRISIDRAEAVGGKWGWRAAMPVTQWVGVKP